MKLSFEQVSIQVDKLYDQVIPLDDLEAIGEQCQLIDSLIEGCGWQVNEFWERWIQEQDINYNEIIFCN